MFSSAFRLVVAISLGGPLLAVGQVPIGGELELAPLEAQSKRRPAIAMSGPGSPVVVWEQPDGVFATALGIDGEVVGPIIEVTSNGAYPDVASDNHGDFVVIWEDRNAAHHVHGKVYMVFFQPEFRVSEEIHVFLGLPRIAMSKRHGRFAVAWGSDSDGVFVRRFGQIGRALGGTLAVSERFAGQPGIGMANSGRFVVTWTSLEGTSAWRFTRAGKPIGRPFEVPGTRVAMDAKGNFVIVWGTTSIFGRCYNRAGRPRGGSFPVSTFPGVEQTDPAVAVDPKGRFVVVWESTGQDGDRKGVFGRQFNSNCRPAGREFQVNTSTLADQQDPAVAIDKKGNFMVVWVSPQGLSASTTIYGQRFRRR